jgi:hypothetical protein
METESRDLLRVFCEAYTLQHGDKWPTREHELAEAFVSYFRIPIVFGVADLQDFLVQTNIELIEYDFPADLLGVNMSFGVKRQIVTSRNPDHIPFRLHTVLHEIREIIEADFRRLGFTTTDSSDLDRRADEFSFAVHICAAKDSMQDWVKDSSETKSTWQSFASLCIVSVIFFLFGLTSSFGAFGYRFQNPSVKRPRSKRI